VLNNIFILLFILPFIVKLIITTIHTSIPTKFMMLFVFIIFILFEKWLENIFICDISRLPHSEYTPLLIKLNMTSLAERRIIIDLKCLYKIVNSLINCPDLLSCLNFNVSQYQTRSTKTFYIPFQRTNYALVSSIIR